MTNAEYLLLLLASALEACKDYDPEADTEEHISRVVKQD